MVDEFQQIGMVCLGLHVRRAARRLTRIYDEALSSAGLTIGQFSLLTTLAVDHEWSMQSLADALGTDRTSLTASLKPLERKKLVRSAPHSFDKRVRRLELTPEGLHTLHMAKANWLVAQHTVEDILGTQDAALIRSAFSKLS
jgi:DNA-binding MarR family transcriptional regulator